VDPDLAVAILVAAGRGKRLGHERPKAFVTLAGEPLLLHAARAFEAAASVGALVAVVPEAELACARALLAPLAKLRAVVPGGARRQDSVRAGLDHAGAGFDGVVLVHDAARPLVEPALVDAVAAAARACGAALPVVPLVDTIKRVDGECVTGTLDRTSLAAAQTPQGFRRGLLERAYAAAIGEGVELTDECMAVERLGEPVTAVPGSAANRKITTLEDLEWAEQRLARRPPERR
jgi:2-C-methyl-D-erythritol 4-phosphate cytidylyltransferase